MFTTSQMRVFLAATLVAAGSGCSLDKQDAPGLTGPSEFATSITLRATPDALARDGVSESIVTLTALGPDGAPVVGLPVVLSLMPSNGGTLSATQVVTDAAGRSTFSYTAPSISTPVELVTIGATPHGTDASNNVMRSTTISLNAPGAAAPQFTVAPQTPERFELTTLDATPTQYAGSSCGAACTYTWTIGSEATLSGQVVTHRFQQQQTYVVMLDVTSPGGVTIRTQQSVAVTAGTPPTAVFTFSPINPRRNETVFFSGSSSTASHGATIVEYSWDFGNGQTATGPNATAVYTQDRTYVVRLTVTDSNGQTHTITQNVAVAL